MTGNTLVDAISEIAFEGNIIPWSWPKALRFPNGKPDLAAIILLADIVYWYRRAEERDEATGELMGWRKRFKADLLQRSYQAFADQTGLTKRQVQEACTRLAKVYRVIRLVFRTIDTPTGRLANVLFIAPLPEEIRAITHQRDRSHIQTGHLSHSNGTPVTSQCETNTEITTEITTEKGEGERTRAQEVQMPVLEQPLTHTPAPSHQMPAELRTEIQGSYFMPSDYTPSAELRAELEGRYPQLDFEEELYAIRSCPFRMPKTNWNATMRKWFKEEAVKHKEKATVGPGKDNGGLRRDTTTTNKHSREIDRGHQLALATFYAAQKQQQAITIPCEDITHADERLPRVSRVVERRGGVLPPRARAGQSGPALLSAPPSL